MLNGVPFLLLVTEDHSWDRGTYTRFLVVSAYPEGYFATLSSRISLISSLRCEPCEAVLFATRAARISLSASRQSMVPVSPHGGHILTGVRDRLGNNLGALETVLPSATYQETLIEASDIRSSRGSFRFLPSMAVGSDYGETLSPDELPSRI